ncbi:nitrate- and nitrite sensing domain-containing protein [Nonomuraea sp. NPDC050404]|uniref:sensor histidine kinase n=1 Tax=Nonomuraea sp. NPDC050404 TaxID=3155783 RepID=UPI0033D6099E
MRTRLVALILIPTVVGVLLAGIQLADAIGTSAEYRRLTQVAELVQRIGALNHELGKERTLTGWYVADRRRTARLVQLKTQRQATDKAKDLVLDATTAIDAAHSARVIEGVETMRRWLDGLNSLRESMVAPDVPARASTTTYSSMVELFATIQDDLGAGVSDETLQGDVAALGSLQRMKEEVSRQQIVLLVQLAQRKIDSADWTEFLGSWDKQQSELAAFEAEASPQDLQAYHQGVRGLQIDSADAMRQRALAQVSQSNRIRDLDVTTTRDINNWYESTTATTNAMHKVGDALATKIVTRTRDLSETEQRNAIISGALILVLLLLVLIITTRVAGSLVRPLRRLRAEALQVATTRLPDTVRVLRESGEGAQIPEVPSVGVNTRDEIGEVARAFDEVHREAIRLAGDEAKLRANVNSMFVNLSRRSQTLVERQLQLIEGLEQGEEDEQRLANLFRLDHLATRMRRNSENLLVLAGQEAARKWSDPVPLVDIARASLSEVENYERVQIQIASGTLIVGPAVTDAVHLLAELIENAISFSPRESKVTVTSTPAEGGVMVTINDLGIGMSQEELAEANWRLANPPVVDVSVSRRMGLFVVGRLALRHGVRVQLSVRETGGLTALVFMPDMLISSGAGMPQQGGQYEAFTTFDPSTFAQQPRNGSHPSFDDAPDQVVDTQWPGSLPAPGTGNWPSFGEQPQPAAEQPSSFGDQPSVFGDQPSVFGEQPPAFGEQRPAFGEQRPAFGEQSPAFGEQPAAFGEQPQSPRADEPRWPSFADDSPSPAAPQQSLGEQRWPSFSEEQPAPAADPQPFAEGKWPSFSEQPPPLRPEEPRWPSFATEPPQQQPSQEEEPRWSSFADPLPRRSLFETEERPRPQFGEDYSSPFRDEPKPVDQFEQNGGAAYNPFGPGEYSSQDMTGPLPVVRNSPLEEQGDEFLPIFSSVGSDWFRRPDPEILQPRAEPWSESGPETTAVHPAVPADPPAPMPPAATLPGTLPPASPGTPPAATTSKSGLPQRTPGQSGAGASWSSPADSGFQAAQAAAQPQQGGTTTSGLPRRVPKANLVPGTASLAEPQATSPAPQISPERLRSRLSSFQQGVRQGRAFTRGEENEEDK